MTYTEAVETILFEMKLQGVKHEWVTPEDINQAADELVTIEPERLLAIRRKHSLARIVSAPAFAR